MMVFKLRRSVIRHTNYIDLQKMSGVRKGEVPL